MKYTYRVREDRITDEEGVWHTVYGIEVLTETGEPLSEYAISDLFCSREQAEELASLCTKLELDPIHLTAVAEDALV
ncbi:MAG: hypothetical protein IJX47_07260 [Clostridia bacterium]|nr:hypothetical protein [Clostridia bacterium]MBQ8382983.1 hypothetical protein [Clostridia bacterium]